MTLRGLPPAPAPPPPRGMAIRRRLALLALGFFSLLATTALAHEGPEHEIDELTALIQQRGESAELLLERAIEFSVLGKNSDALRDLERAARLDPGSLHVLRELANALFRSGRTDDALATLERALRLPLVEPIDQAGILQRKAEMLLATRQPRAALTACEAALRQHALNPEWYLLRSDLQRRLGLHRERLQGLDQGIRQTGSGLLRIERIEALLDDRQFAPALELIEPELRGRRVRHAWLVRRGRALIGLGRTPEGQHDLQTALADIERVLDPARPDPGLLLQQAQALASLGNRDALRACTRLAKEKRLDPALLDTLDDLLRSTRNPTSANRRDKTATSDRTKPTTRPQPETNNPR